MAIRDLLLCVLYVDNQRTEIATLLYGNLNIILWDIKRPGNVKRNLGVCGRNKRTFNFCFKYLVDRRCLKIKFLIFLLLGNGIKYILTLSTYTSQNRLNKEFKVFSWTLVKRKKKLPGILAYMGSSNMQKAEADEL